jgi:hypothetical protein
MSELPKYTDDLGKAVELSWLGLADLKVEGGQVPQWMLAGTEASPGWLSRVTEWPRRKLARALERAANFICRDRDEGW